MNDSKNMPPSERQSPPASAKRSGVGCSIALALLLVGLVAAAVIGGPQLLRLFDIRNEVSPLPASANEQAQKLLEQRGQEIEKLNQYGWVDKNAGIARIPIARAIALIAAQGLPVGIPATATPAPTAAISNSAEVTATTPAVDLAHVDFARDVLPIFDQHCTECHGDDNPEEGLELTSRKKVMAGSLNGGVVKPGDPDNSYLVEMIVSGKMPKRGDPLTQAEIDIITAWIKAGALDSPAASEAISATTTLSATTQISATDVLSESTAISATAAATPTLDLSAVDLDVDLDNVSFTKDVLPIFAQHCTECHGDDNPEEGLELTSRKKIMAGSLNGGVVKPGDPEGSYLVKMVVEGKMPKRGDPLSPLEIDIIKAWIQAGALDDSTSSAATSASMTTTTTLSNTEKVTTTASAAKPAATATATPVVNASQAVTATATVSRTKPATATPAVTATQTVTRSATVSGTSTPTATKRAASVEPTVTITETAPVTVSVMVTATNSSTSPLTETTAISSTFDPTQVDLNNVSFKSDVLPIFKQHCFKCHGDENPEEGLELTSRKKIMAGSLNGGVVKPGDADASYLVEMIVKGKMPKKGDPLTQPEIDIIVAWIEAGALDN